MEKLVIVDSGIGGLSVFNHLLELNCNKHVTYLADNYYFPYGTKSDHELIQIIDRILSFFINHKYSEVILACNTASVIYSKYLFNKYPIPIYPIIDNTVLEIKKIPNCKRIGVIGTNKTIESKAYQTKLQELTNAKITALGCSDLVALCEAYDITKIKAYMNDHFNVLKEIDTLILGCTHFNVIKEMIDDYFYHNIRIIPSGFSLIESYNNNSNKENFNDRIIYVTGNNDHYLEIINKLFPKLKSIKISQIKL